MSAATYAVEAMRSEADRERLRRRAAPTLDRDAHEDAHLAS